MNMLNSQTFFIFSFALLVFLMYLLAPILTPFMLGALLAYLATPAVKWLKRCRFSHMMSVIIVFMLIIFAMVMILLMIIPLIQRQIVMLIEEMPKIVTWLETNVL